MTINVYQLCGKKAKAISGPITRRDVRNQPSETDLSEIGTRNEWYQSISNHNPNYSGQKQEVYYRPKVGRSESAKTRKYCWTLARRNPEKKNSIYQFKNSNLTILVEVYITNIYRWILLLLKFGLSTFFPKHKIIHLLCQIWNADCRCKIWIVKCLSNPGK